jgi:NAD-dependent SIR2 family protein deacetylase
MLSESSEIINPNLLQQQFSDEVLHTVYWKERSSKHMKPFLPSDNVAIEAAITTSAVAIKDSDAVLFITGAGAGVDMGLPDFRTSNAFWETLAHPEISRYEDSSDNAWFEKDPHLTWGINFHQLAMYREAKIHDGYYAMKDIASLKSDNYFCFTTNIDGVLLRAGFDAGKVREVHGNIHRMQCTRYDCKNEAGVRDTWEEHVDLKYDQTSFRAEDPLPKCPHCGALSRPNVWFCKDSAYVLSEKSGPICDNYFRWLDSLESAQQEEKQTPEKKKKLVVIEIGAGLAIPSARVEAEDVAERFGGTLIRVNPVDYMIPMPSQQELGAEETKLSNTNATFTSIAVPLGAAAALTRIVDRMRSLN